MNIKKVYKVCLCIVLCFLLLAHILDDGSLETISYNNEIKLAILMYHGFTNGGKESEYVIDVSKFEEDIIYLKKNGFEFVNTNDLLQYVKNGITLPQKCVMITFDDGYLNNYTYAYPIIKKHEVKTMISPIAYYVEYYTIHNEPNPIYAQLGEKEIKEMQKSGLIEFQNHSYNMHSLDKRKGSSKLSDEKNEEYIREFYYDLKSAENVIKEITGKRPLAYVYPFGSISKESKSILKCCGYELSMSCEEGFNYISRDGNDLYFLKRFNRTPKKSAEQILSHY